MFLKYIELTGFKSFADRIKLEFHPGVTAIVGPNGCGKSNVLDAVRWVLGEQSARALRGREMADLIFNGTDTRKPLGMAEVLLTFADCQGELGIDYSEVTVGRRVFRDGSSEYELNGKICRLKDIQSLFMDTGIGRTAYSIMEQGKINQLLSAKPEDRREVFEEAAGITKYKSQKRETLRKLEATEANLLRVTDIIKEVKRQITSLQRQANKARKYQEIFSELKLLEWMLAHQQWLSSTAQSESIKKSLDEKRALISKLQSSLQQIEEKSSLTRKELDLTETQLEESRQRQLSGRTEQQRLQGQIGFNNERLQSLDTADDIAHAEIAQLQERLTIQKQSADSLQSEIDETRNQARKLTSRLAEQQNAHLTAELALNDIRQRLSAERREQERREAEWGRLAQELAARDAERRTAQLRIESFERDKEDIRSAKTTLAASLEEKNSLLNKAEDRINSAREQLQNARLAAQTSEQKLAAATAQRSAAECLLLQTESRLRILESLEKNREGLSSGTQHLLENLAAGNATASHSGTLADKIQIKTDAAAAIERLLQGKLEALLLSDPEELWSIARWWKNNGKNQRIWLAQTGGMAPPAAVAALPTESALRVISAPDDLKPLLARLLGDALIADDLDHARALRQHHPGAPIATRSGDLLSRDGTLELSGEVRLAKVFERREEMRTLAATLEKQLSEKNSADLLHQQALAERDNSLTLVENAREALRQAERERDEIAADIRRIQQEIAVLERREHDIARQIQAIADAENRAEQRFAQQTARRAEIEALRASAEQTLLLLSQQLTQKEADTAAATALLTELRVQSASLEEKRKSLETQAAAQRERQNELEKNLAARHTQLSDNALRRVTIQRETAELQEQLKLLAGELAELDTTLASLTEKRARLLAETHTANDEERRLRSQLTTLQDQRAELELQLEKQHLALEALLERASRRFQLTADDIATGPAEPPPLEGGPDAWSSRAAELNQLIDRIGPVNIEAITEFEELQAREKFLDDQFNDLTKSKDQLTKAIEQLNISTHKMFSETFEKIKTNFQSTFSELFGGGKATIQLQDENDPLECGIDIIAKPPGKEPKSIVSLSGGEQTLTAVALLFAIYMVKPSPFCILDEMDAPLDESNINRFLNILRRFVHQSQFLLITHNKRTIAFADAIYGVTQEDRGVSKVVSVRFSPVEKKNSPPPDSEQTPAQQQQQPQTENPLPEPDTEEITNPS
jgi:chromosome segregation protein